MIPGLVFEKSLKNYGRIQNLIVTSLFFLTAVSHLGLALAIVCFIPRFSNQIHLIFCDYEMRKA